jgi:hypothetical protein
VGTILPEDKGMQILLIVLSLYYALKDRDALSSVALGLSVAFKGLGIFIYPMMATIWWKSGNKKITDHFSQRSQRIGLPGDTDAVFPEVFWMMQGRPQTNVNAMPIHGSIWRLPAHIVGDKWVI